MLKRSLSGLIFLWAALSGCQTLYNPGLPQVPLMMGGDETQIAINGGTNGYGLQVAYSPYYNWVVMGNGSSFNTYLDIQYREKYQHRQGELGTGFYTTLNKYLRAEFIGGIGGSHSGINTDLRYLRRVFLQPSVGISTPYFDTGITSRFSFVQFYKERTGFGETKRNETGVFWEPALMLRAGYEQVKFNLQLGWAVPLGDTDIAYRNMMVGGGVHLTLFRDFDRFKYL